MMKKLKKKKGFTLIELIIVIAILGILAAIAVPRFAGTRQNAQAGADAANAKIIYNATVLLVEQGAIDEGINDIPVTINASVNVTHAADNTNADADDAAGQLICNQLGDNVPTLQAGGNFQVDIDANGRVTVTNASGATIFPQ